MSISDHEGSAIDRFAFVPTHLLQEMSYLIGDARHGATCSRSLWRPKSNRASSVPNKGGLSAMNKFCHSAIPANVIYHPPNLSLHYLAVHTICIGNIWARERKTHGDDVKTKESKHPNNFLRDWQFISSLTFNNAMALFQKKN